MISKLLRTVTVPLAMNKIDIGRYFFPESLLKSIEYTTLSGFHNGKHILLASPHPGSGLSMRKLSLFMAQKCKSDHYLLDYHWFVQASKSLPKRSAPRPLIGHTRSFSPGEYETYQEDDMSDHDVEEDKSPKMFFNFVTGKDGGKPFLSEVKVLPAEKELHSGTHYDSSISEEDLEIIIKGLKEEILEKGSRTIISIADITDMIESTPNGSGSRIVLELIEMVNDIVSEGNEALIYAHSTPSLLDEENLSKTCAFYADLFDGNVSLSESGQVEECLWEEGAFFRTVLDGMKPNKFTKIPLSPPTPTSIFHLGSYDAFKAEEIFEKWLKIMEEDTRLGVKEINWKNLNFCLQNRKANLVGLNSDDILCVSAKISDSLSNLLKDWEKRICSLDDVDYVASLMAGQRLALMSDTKKNEQMLDVTVDQLESALQLASTMNYKSFHEEIHDSDTVKVDTAASNEISRGESIETPSAVKSRISELSNFNDILKSAKISSSSLNQYEKRMMSTVINPSNISVEFKDLILPSSTKLMLQTIVTLPLLRPAYFSEGILSRHSINGVLLFGPPGTGKTMLAKAIAKSSGTRFMNVSLSQIFDKYVGEGEKNVRAIFTLARKISPCIIFLDEMDALFGARRNDIHSSKREIINEFMSEWDGLASENRGIVILGATNRPFDLDDAILRRLPRRVMIDLPTEEQRLLILQVHLKGETLDSDISLADLAKRTTSYSGSDLKNLCVAAALCRIKEAIYQNEACSSQLKLDEISSKLEDLDDWNTLLVSKKSESLSTLLSPLCMRHFEKALKEVSPSLTDEMQTLIDLRKWDKQFGENATPLKKQGWGF